ncbi:conserved hypothetical protein [Methanococcus vannielii SB]|uniref:Uncharacterized protein n=1 Tax=Methanococcus vannielii (strain ATCC 35089 / DSM 1224 / JCM 13029 / OCM 148 / SB) TaxID=406327 RepID=A6UNN2_METVS|nr:hypothetical protein [Methanococcus vannielii]ABR54104.1 conserved hypothetical protein [Methanococcus vannielii SB]
MKITNMNSLISAIIGGIYFGTYLPFILVLFFIFNKIDFFKRFKSNTLFFYSIYIVVFSYLHDFKGIFISSIILMIIIPHTLVLLDLIDSKNFFYDTKNYLILILIIFGIFNINLFSIGILILLFFKLKNFLNKFILVLLIPILTFLIMFFKYEYFLNQNYIQKVFMLTGFGIILYSIYAFLNQKNEK